MTTRAPADYMHRHNVSGKASLLWTFMDYKKDVTSTCTSFLSRRRIILFLQSTKYSSWLHCHGVGSTSSWCNKWCCFICFIIRLYCCLHICSSRPVSCSVLTCHRSFANWACSLPLSQPWIYTLAMVGMLTRKYSQPFTIFVFFQTNGTHVIVIITFFKLFSWNFSEICWWKPVTSLL